MFLFRMFVAFAISVGFCVGAAVLLEKRMELIYAILWLMVCGANFLSRRTALVGRKLWYRTDSVYLAVYFSLLVVGFLLVSQGGEFLHGAFR
jgi:hypothetical protein